MRAMIEEPRSVTSGSRPWDAPAGKSQSVVLRMNLRERAMRAVHESRGGRNQKMAVVLVMFSHCRRAQGVAA